MISGLMDVFLCMLLRSLRKRKMCSAAWGVAHSYGNSFSQQVATDGSACPLEVPVPLNIVRIEMPENYSFFIFLKRQNMKMTMRSI